MKDKPDFRAAAQRRLAEYGATHPTKPPGDNSKKKPKNS